MAAENLSRSSSIKEIASALSKAQGEFPSIPKNRTAKVKMKAGGEYAYKYADLADVIAGITATLKTNGLSHAQFPTLNNGTFGLETLIMHSSGEWMSSFFPMVQHERPQDMGSEITYTRRYALCAALGIQADEDDDGAIAQNTAPKVAKGQKPNTPAIFEDEVFDPGSYVIKIGNKYKGQKLSEMDSFQLDSYLKWVRQQETTKGAPLTGDWLEFAENAEAFLKSREFERQPR